MTVRLEVDAPYSGHVEVVTPIDYTMMDDKAGIKAALVDAVHKVARMYELDVEIH